MKATKCFLNKESFTNVHNKFFYLENNESHTPTDNLALESKIATLNNEVNLFC